MAEGDGKEGPHFLCLQFCPGKTDRAGRPGPDVHLSRPRLDGLCRTEEPDQAGDTLEPPWQSHRAHCPEGQGSEHQIRPGFDLAKVLGDGRLSIANVDSVPAGKYGKAALEKLGVWPSVSNKIAQAENVRAALLLVSRGET